MAPKALTRRQGPRQQDKIRFFFNSALSQTTVGVISFCHAPWNSVTWWSRWRFHRQIPSRLLLHRSHYWTRARWTTRRSIRRQSWPFSQPVLRFRPLAPGTGSGRSSTNALSAKRSLLVFFSEANSGSSSTYPSSLSCYKAYLNLCERSLIFNALPISFRLSEPCFKSSSKTVFVQESTDLALQRDG